MHLHAPASSRNRRRQIIQLVLKLQNHSLRSLLPNPRNPRQRGMIPCTNRTHKSSGINTAKHRNRELRPNPRNRKQLLKQPLLLPVGKPKQSQLILPHMCMDIKAYFGTLRHKRREGSHANGHVIPNTTTFNNGLIRAFRKKASAQVSNHAARDCSVSCLVINKLSSRSDTAENLIRDRPCKTSMIVSSNAVAKHRNLIAQTGRGYIGHINSSEIHRDPPNNWRALPMDHDPSSRTRIGGGKLAAQAIGITDRKQSQPHRPSRREAGVVPNGVAGSDLAKVADSGLPCHD